jgi:AmmeMemoRadiSam system protein B
MPFLGAIVVPHPPLILPQVGRGGERQIAQTAEAYRRAAAFIVAAAPDTVILTTPHSILYQDYFHLSPGESAAGDMARFGAPQVRLEVAYDAELTRAVSRRALSEGFPAGTQGQRDAALDHASLVPLQFIKEAAGGHLPFRLVRVGLSGLSFAMHAQLGRMLAEEAESLHRRWCFVASGDLSHYLKKSGPYGFRPEGLAYDNRIMEVLGRGAFDELLAMDDAACERAGECGHRSFCIMAGALEGLPVRATALSYQDVTGVGYGVCTFEPLDSTSAMAQGKETEA